MALGNVQARGQVTLLRDVRERAGIKSGDVLSFHVLGPGEIRVTTVPNLGPRELRDR